MIGALPFLRFDLTDSLIAPAAMSALTLEYAKLHIRALGMADDALTAVRIDAASSYFSEQTGRPTITETRVAGLNRFPFLGASGADARIELPHPPLQRVRSVEYIDANGILQPFTASGSPATPFWRAVTYAGPYARRGFVEPLYGQVWPTARLETDSVRITYDCGYGDTPDDVPPLVRGIICALVSHFDTYPHDTHDGRATTLPYSVDALLASFKYSAYPSQVLREAGWMNGVWFGGERWML